MKSSKTRQVSNTVAFSSIFLSLVVCFVALVHVEFELHAHRQMLQVLSQKREDNFEPRKTIQNEPITLSFHSDSVESKLRDFLFYKLHIHWRRRDVDDASHKSFRQGDPQTANDPQNGPKMLLDGKWPPTWTANDPVKIEEWNGS